MRRCLLSLFFMVAAVSSAMADVAMHKLFSNHMVLQQGSSTPVWGTANPGEEVRVTFNGQLVSTKADDKGNWKVQLKDLKAGGPYELLIEGKNKIKLEDVLVGEVWICSGQSNMEWPVNACHEPEAVKAKCENSKLRLFQVQKKTSATPKTDIILGGPWMECNAKNLGNFTAVGYHFGKNLQEARNVPVGLIQTAWGGTPAEAWTNEEFLGKTPELNHYLTSVKKASENWNSNKQQLLNKYEEDKKNHDAKVVQAKAEGKTAPGNAPRRPTSPDDNPNSPARLYNAMIHPLINCRIAGAIWYQGESNAGRAYEYRTLMPTMIECWRAQFQQDVPFFMVQLAPFQKIVDEPQESNWAELREAQWMTTKKLPKVGMAVITDVGDPNDIHPKKKAPVGERLALQARKVVYGENIPADGPLYEGVSYQGNKAIVRFAASSLGGGLVAKDGELKGFTIAGADKKFKNAVAKIEGDTVVVSSPDVANPVAVRFGWYYCPVVNFWNKAGLPATPFRTDDWPGMTWPKTQ